MKVVTYRKTETATEVELTLTDNLKEGQEVLNIASIADRSKSEMDELLKTYCFTVDKLIAKYGLSKDRASVYTYVSGIMDIEFMETLSEHDVTLIQRNINLFNIDAVLFKSWVLSSSYKEISYTDYCSRDAFNVLIPGISKELAHYFNLEYFPAEFLKETLSGKTDTVKTISDFYKLVLGDIDVKSLIAKGFIPYNLIKTYLAYPGVLASMDFSKVNNTGDIFYLTMLEGGIHPAKVFKNFTEDEAYKLAYSIYRENIRRHLTDVQLYCILYPETPWYILEYCKDLKSVEWAIENEHILNTSYEISDGDTVLTVGRYVILKYITSEDIDDNSDKRYSVLLWKYREEIKEYERINLFLTKGMKEVSEKLEQNRSESLEE